MFYSQFVYCYIEPDENANKTKTARIKTPGKSIIATDEPDKTKGIASIEDGKLTAHNPEDKAQQISVNRSKEHKEKLREKMKKKFIIDSSKLSPKKKLSPLRDFYAVPTHSNFCAIVFPTVSFKNPDCATLKVIAKLLETNYLHKYVREIGGAYAAGAAQNRNLFGMFTYRDPNHMKLI